MAQQEEDEFVDFTTLSGGNLFPMESDAAFSATPLFTNASKSDEATAHSDPTFMQNQISIQRSPSTAILHASALSRKLSIKSSGSQEAINHSISGVLSENSDTRGRRRGDSDSSVIEATNSCNLAKSSSSSTNRSTKSAKSVKSVSSVHAVGSYPLGSLRVHSPSPTKTLGNPERRDFLLSGDVVIARDVPGGSLFGYDTRGMVIKTEENFQGIRDIPAGAHLIWGGSSTDSLRSGFWIMSKKRASDEYGEVHVMRWDKDNEVLSEEFSAAEARIQKQNVAEIFDKLQKYTIPIPNPAAPMSQTRLTNYGTSQTTAQYPNIWHHLTSSMKGALLTKITGHGWNHWEVSSTHDYKPEVRLSGVPDDSLHKDRDEVLKFVFPKSTRTFSQTSVGRDRTEQAMDTSAHIVAVIAGNCTYEDSDEIIGELQFCYVTGMILGNLACMEHWAHIVKVLFRAFRLALDLPVFFLKVIEAVHSQLIYDETGTDGSILEHDSDLPEDLKMILTVFKSRLNELLLARGSNITPDQQAVGVAFEALESYLWKWHWDLRGSYVRSGKVQLEDGEFVDAELNDFEAEDERGEYAPVVVAMDEDGHERDLVRL